MDWKELNVYMLTIQRKIDLFTWLMVGFRFLFYFLIPEFNFEN
jgi:hypothetical protein